MNKLTIIGNLTADPELRTTPQGKSVCSFRVAVNRPRRSTDQAQEADFFRVSVWNALGETCAKYLAKGRKVCVVGDVRLHIFEGNNGKAGASMEVTAQDVEFLSPKSESIDKQSGMQVVQPDGLPY